VDRTTAAQLTKQLVRRALLPELALGEFHALQVAFNRRHRDLLDRRADAAPILLAGWPVRLPADIARARAETALEREFGPGDTFHMPPGHDAWIVGDEACVLLDFGGLKGYATSG
jgi:hypothetical protein